MRSLILDAYSCCVTFYKKQLSLSQTHFFWTAWPYTTCAMYMLYRTEYISLLGLWQWGCDNCQNMKQKWNKNGSIKSDTRQLVSVFSIKYCLLSSVVKWQNRSFPEGSASPPSGFFSLPSVARFGLRFGPRGDLLEAVSRPVEGSVRIVVL